ncbi:putative adipose-regulatory protein-domain-containing protein [Immersiella caudata]|uniref:Adipose-regulatory protein-domain-containing protein n=1 Tax=Immersiella caudata TaxID=314043 RepID=A0AA39WKI4_9PEZI|nr:putative adipose-regulatory protein-domain-containing protein [Immersiella caudata]
MDELRERGAELWQALGDLRDACFRVLFSRKLQRALLTVIAFTASSVTVGFLSVPIYGAFYHFHLPDQIVEVPVYLQYGYGANPFAVASLRSTNVKNSQAYDIDIALTVPQSPENLAYGNFMVGLLLLGESRLPPPQRDAPPPRYDNKVSPFTSIVQPVDIATYTAHRQVMHVSTRPTRVPYRSSLVSQAAALLRLPYYAVWPGSETTTVVVRMADHLMFGRGMPVPDSILVEVQAGQGLQVYDATVTLTAQLHGLRYFMYQYRLTAFAIFMTSFWVTGMVTFSLLFTVTWPFGSPKGGKVKVEDDEGDLEDEDDIKGKRPAIKKEGELSDTERTFPSSSKQPALKYEPKVKQEAAEESNIPPLNIGALADDENDEEDWRARDSGIGTSFSDNLSRQGTRRRSTKGGS